MAYTSARQLAEDAQDRVLPVPIIIIAASDTNVSQPLSVPIRFFRLWTTILKSIFRQIFLASLIPKSKKVIPVSKNLNNKKS